MRQLMVIGLLFLSAFFSNLALAQSLDYQFYHDDGQLPVIIHPPGYIPPTADRSDHFTPDYRKSTHVRLTPGLVAAGAAGDNDIVAYMYWHLFCRSCPTIPGYKFVRADIDTSVRRGLDLLQDHKHRVKMWSIVDEPYIKGIPRNEVEYAMSRVFWISQTSPYNYSPNIPRWVNFAHDCFLENYTGNCSAKPDGEEYSGIPGNATLLSFDWYTVSTQETDCGNGTADCHSDEHIQQTINPTLNALKSKIYGYQDILLYPGTWSGGNSGNSANDKHSIIGTNEILARYTDIALNDPRIKGVVPFTFIHFGNATTVNKFDGIAQMPDGEQGEMFYQAMAIENAASLQNSNYTPIFEYNDDKDFQNSGLSVASTHKYTKGYDGAVDGNYAVRRLAFYTHKLKSGIYTKKTYRCVVQRANSRVTVFFARNSSCYGVNVIDNEHVGYISPISQGEANNAIINCRSAAAPYWDQGWTMLPPGGNASNECVRVFGSGYTHWTTIGYSKRL